VVAGVACLAVAAAAVAYPLLWQHHQDVAGQRAIAADRSRARAVAHAATSGACRARPGPGVLVIPALQVTAPVEQGLSDGVLAVALGHDPSTAWPAPGASTLVAGHDVGYLHADDRLRPGDAVDYEEPCATLHYTVTGHQVTQPGQRVPLPAGGGLVLDTCWPTDALWYTPQRYLVVARYVSTTTRAGRHPAARATPAVPAVVLPAGLAATQLTLAANSWPMGTLTVKGAPSAAWTASQSSLTAEADALELLFGLRHGLAAGDATWLAALAPGVAVPAWLDGAPAASLDVTLTVRGGTVTGAALASSVQAAGGDQPFRVSIAVGGDGGWRVTAVTG
jgi:sortase A